MNVNIIKCLMQVASYLKVQPGKIQIGSNLIPVRTINDSTTKGFVSIIFEMLKEAKCNFTNPLDIAEVRQWLEYCIVYTARADGSQNIENMLKELNNLLSTKTYLVSYKMTVADIVLYYMLHNVMGNLSYLDKEKYLHVSRWFDNLQQNSLVRQKNTIVDFKTNYLIVAAPVKH
ncbi:hypothetical protein RN001_000242 [Aquatica leii]|uniref:GST C-terminal domain-containing protein n=1 Tax=Aquatica leii TaxID=1421715 RepID=A0AAN7PM13_9COLE|nr:hypothetical protein RN001_000242 [Aquatica leii]